MQLAAEECEVFQKAVYSWIEEFAQENLITEKMREMREDREGKELQLKDEFNRASIFFRSSDLLFSDKRKNKISGSSCDTGTGGRADCNDQQ